MSLIKIIINHKKLIKKNVFNRLLMSTNHINCHINLKDLCIYICSISSIFLFELFLMISDTYICKAHVFKVVLSLTLLNSLRLLKCRKKCKTNFLSYISKIFLL